MSLRDIFRTIKTTPTIFFALIPRQKKTWSLKRLRFMARQSRFIIRRIASCTGGAIHKSAFSDETTPFHSAMKHFRFRSNMKHSAYAAYDEKMKNKSFCLQYMPCAVILPLEIKFLFGKKLQKNRFFTKNKSDIPARLLYY